ncbi:MAG: HD domain-containing protein [Syntrophobacteraceae bacterium]
MYDLTLERDVFLASLPFMEAAKALAIAEGMNDHGPLHAQRVYALVGWLGILAGLSAHEGALLKAAALLHDIGMSGGREQHHNKSAEIVAKLCAEGMLPFNPDEAEIVATLCKWHRREYEPDAIHPRLRTRTGMLATLLRLADGMDLDYRRSDCYEIQEPVISRVHQGQVPHHLSVQCILGIRLHTSRAGTELQLLIDQITPASLQLDRLVDELVRTPVAWPVKIIPLRKQTGFAHLFNTLRRAMVFSYCNAHGIVEAGLSKRGLEMTGFSVEVVCDWHRTGSPEVFWAETFSTCDLSDTSFVVILDIDASENLEVLLRAVRQNPNCSFLYATPLDLQTDLLKALVDAGVDVLLGDARLLFAGTALEEHGRHWIKVAGLCNADDWLISSGGFERVDFLAARGLRNELLNLIESNADLSGYASIVDKVATGDMNSFVRQESAWSSALEKKMPTVQRRGRVVILQPVGTPGRFTYDFAHLAIERQGVLPWERNEFTTPFAICRRPLDDGRERVLYVSRFSRLENAIPVKYFVPYSREQLGSGATIWQTYSSTDAASRAIEATISRINEHFKCER